MRYVKLAFLIDLLVLLLLSVYSWVSCLVQNHVSMRKHKIFAIDAITTKKAFGSKGSSEIFYCENCGVEHIKWVGRCTSCNEWNTVKQFRRYELKDAPTPSASLDIRSRLKPDTKVKSFINDNVNIKNSVLKEASDVENDSSLVSLKSIDIEAATTRFNLFSKEMNRVVGGGLVPGSVILLSGEPGIGKSTLLLQLSGHLSSSTNRKVVYLSGEETAQQIASRANRLSIDSEGIYLMNEIDIDQAINKLIALPVSPIFIIVDSIQTIYTSTASGGIGSVNQIRECATRLVQYAKLSGTSILLVGHVTKSGDIAGPKLLEHCVDTVLNLEGTDLSDYRLLRTTKNRFGSTSEIGVFTMTSKGLIDVFNPSELFLSSSLIDQDGSTVTVTMEGTRPILAEVQSLVGAWIPPYIKSTSKRTIEGYSLQRLSLICAVIEKILKLTLFNRDIYVNIVGGLRISEPVADLAIAVTIVSSYLRLPIKKNTVFVGEVGLGGEIRNCRNIDQRIAEAANMGFNEIVVPRRKLVPWSQKRKSLPSSNDHDDRETNVVEQSCQCIARECVSLKEALGVAFNLSSIELDSIISQRKSKRKSKIASSTPTTDMEGDDDIDDGDDDDVS